MIKSIELRLGNKIFIAGIDYDSGGNAYNDPDGDEEIVVDIDTLKDVIEKPFKYKYIPLTSELLERFGWQIIDQGRGPYYWLEKQCWFHIHLSSDGSLYANFNNNAVPVKHLHHLQNLYFSLTGVELTIKETV